MTLKIYLSRNGKTAIGTDVMTAWFASGVGLVKYIEHQELSPLKEDHSTLTEMIEELEEYTVNPVPH